MMLLTLEAGFVVSSNSFSLQLVMRGLIENLYQVQTHRKKRPN